MDMKKKKIEKRQYSELNNEKKYPMSIMQNIR